MASSRSTAHSAQRVDDAVDSLVLDLLEWIGPGARPYGETVEAWRTSCPRLPVWEQANELGLISRRRGPQGDALVAVSPTGVEHLRRCRPALGH